MSDKEHALAPLRNPEELCVRACPCARIPALIHRPEEGTKVPSRIRRQQSRDVFKHEPCRAYSSNNSKGDEGQDAARVIHSSSFSRNAEGLAGASENKDIWFPMRQGPLAEVGGRNIPEVDGFRMAMRQHGGRERLDLRAPQTLPPEAFRGHLRSADAGEEGGQFHPPRTAIPRPANSTCRANVFIGSSAAFQY
jgi:hypothetical protein